MNSVLQVNNISKSFKDYSSEWQRIFSWFGLVFSPIKENQVLKNINFSIAQGEAVGIIGQNGAGKSTLLKIITETLKPSEGSIQVNGRISAILELGMGFHPDLTGRQNVYHSAGLMGFSHKQIDAVIDEIKTFTEIGEYFDQPVRTYSSGMQMRVAFAIVTAYRPEILIVDEALSVGDTYFQHKSLDRIKKFQEQGTTLLLVSHDSGTINAICNRAILLESGNIIKDGPPEDVMNYYNALIAQKEDNNKIEQIVKEDGRIVTISGTKEATIKSVELYNDKKEKVEFVGVGDLVKLTIEVNIHTHIPELVLGYMIKDRLGQPIFGTNTHHLNTPIKDLKKGNTVFYTFSFYANLGTNSYSIAVAAHAGDSHVVENYEWKDNALLFKVINTSHEEFIGSSWLPPKLEYTIER